MDLRFPAPCDCATAMAHMGLKHEVCDDMLGLHDTSRSLQGARACALNTVLAQPGAKS